MRKLTSVAAAIGSALLVTYGATAQAGPILSPSAYAESELLITNFRVLGVAPGTGAAIPGNPNFGVTPCTGGPAGCTEFNLSTGGAGSLTDNGIAALQASVSSQIKASINGVDGVPTPHGDKTIAPLTGETLSHKVAAGPDAGNYTPYSSWNVSTMGPGVFSGAVSDHSGNGIGPGTPANPFTTAMTQAQVNINGANSEGSASARQALATQFSLTLTSGQIFDVLFDAEAFMRVELGQDDIQAKANRAWSLTVEKILSPLSTVIVLDWQPQGTTGIGGSNACEALNLCAELYDPFDLNVNASTLDAFDGELVDLKQQFGIRAALSAGTYKFSVGHFTSADAGAFIPEPGSLALLGVSLLSLVGVRRRSK